jgi:hypothetical protein
VHEHANRQHAHPNPIASRHVAWDARVIITGIPIGARYADESCSATYVRDPGNAFGDPATGSAFDPHAKLPEDAADTGLRQQGTQLWVGPIDRSAIYLVAGASVERWPLDPDPASCA